MKKEDVIKKLEELDFPEIEPQGHKRRLKMALLSSAAFDKRSFCDLFPIYKNFKELSVQKKRYALIGAASAIALVAVAAGSFVFSFNPNTVNAQEVAQKSYNTVSSMSAEELQLLCEKVKNEEPLALLAMAKEAGDLQVLTAEEFISELNSQRCGVEMDLPDEFKNVTFLKFTAPDDGMKVVLGVDKKTDLPVLTIMVSVDGSGAAGVGIARDSACSGSEQMSTVTIIDTTTGETYITGTISLSEGILTVDGSTYAVPADAGDPLSIEMRDDGVYINGIKAEPVE